MATPNSAPTLPQLVQRAVSGDSQPLTRMLSARGGLPGPRPNIKLATEAAQALTASGRAGERLLASYRQLGDDVAPETVSDSFLPMVGVIALGISQLPSDGLASVLADHADDSRRAVRDAVSLATRTAMTKGDMDQIMHADAWREGYFQASVLLHAVGDSAWLQQVSAPDVILQHVDTCFVLLKEAPRAHQRTHGYRDLLRAMEANVPLIGKRFPYETLDWLGGHAHVTTPVLRDLIDKVLRRLRKLGVRPAQIDLVHDTLRAHDAPARDPRSYVGPTRGRGKKGRRKR